MEQPVAIAIVDPPVVHSAGLRSCIIKKEDKLVLVGAEGWRPVSTDEYEAMLRSRRAVAFKVGTLITWIAPLDALAAWPTFLREVPQDEIPLDYHSETEDGLWVWIKPRFSQYVIFRDWIRGMALSSLRDPNPNAGLLRACMAVMAAPYDLDAIAVQYALTTDQLRPRVLASAVAIGYDDMTHERLLLHADTLKRYP